jgi:hypothetical protein
MWGTLSRAQPRVAQLEQFMASMECGLLDTTVPGSVRTRRWPNCKALALGTRGSVETRLLHCFFCVSQLLLRSEYRKHGMPVCRVFGVRHGTRDQNRCEMITQRPSHITPLPKTNKWAKPSVHGRRSHLSGHAHRKAAKAQVALRVARHISLSQPHHSYLPRISLHPPPSTLHPPPSTLHPPPSTLHCRSS